MRLTLGFSSCPNDTFIFDALLHGKVDTEGLEFEPVIADVEELNQRAFRRTLHITKLSYHAFAFLLKDYALLEAGSALGKNVGPLLIARTSIPETDIPSCTIAIPGKYTTANFLLSLAFPDAGKREPMLFSGIEGAVLRADVDAGLIIHENRFTYAERGLVKLMDLGEYWESTTQMPIPLGGIVVRRDLPEEVQQSVNRVMQRSVAYAMGHPKESLEFVRQHAQEMEEKVMYQHIELYVNEFTRALGQPGRAAVQRMFDIAMAKGVIPTSELPIFV